MNIQTIVAFIVVHWAIILAILYVALDTVIAVTPKRFQKTPVFGLILQAFHFVSVHVHFDEVGTIKVPVLNLPIRLGAVSPPAKP